MPFNPKIGFGQFLEHSFLHLLVQKYMEEHIDIGGGALHMMTFWVVPTIQVCFFQSTMTPRLYHPKGDQPMKNVLDIGTSQGSSSAFVV